jgi:uncharacterized membrane protein
MTSQTGTIACGKYIYGLGVLMLGILCLASGNSIAGQALPKGIPARAALVYAAGAFLIVASAAIAWRRTAAGAAAALTAYFAVVGVLLMNGPVVLAHYAKFGAYFGVAEQLSLAAGGLIVVATNARLEAIWAARLSRIGRMKFGVCALFFGTAHFVFMNLTAPLVPKWLPPNGEFWGYVTGVGFIAAGVALLTGVQAHLAAILLTIMLASFALLVHAPTVLADVSNRGNWGEAALNIAVTGVAWVAVDSLAQIKSSISRFSAADNSPVL